MHQQPVHKRSARLLPVPYCLPLAGQVACRIPFLSFVSAMLCSIWLLGVRVTRVTGM